MTRTDNDLLRIFGARLRQVRERCGWSLVDVQIKSRQQFTASELGKYERGERVLSVLRLYQLAEFYECSVFALLPPDEEPSA